MNSGNESELEIIACKLKIMPILGILSKKQFQ